MSFVNDIFKAIYSITSARVFDVTIIIEKDNILIGKKTYRKLMTYEKALKMVE